MKNGWDHLAQEVLISTPRRFGKTISVSMFAAAMLYAAPKVELSIYSTCKRISQKLLRNIQKFFYIICNQDITEHQFRVIRQNMEEIVMQGPIGSQDVRIVNSYPSKVKLVYSKAKVCLQLFCSKVIWEILTLDHHIHRRNGKFTILILLLGNSGHSRRRSGTMIRKDGNE